MAKYETSNPDSAAKPPLVVDLLVLPGASLLTLACAGDPLRAANRVAGRTVFNWRYVSIDGNNPVTSAGLEWRVSGQFDPDARRDVFGVVAAFGAADIRDRKLLPGIFRASKRAEMTIGIESGAWLLARVGLLDGRRATTHWEDFEDFAAAFPGVNLRPDRYVTDGRFVTTSGASPTFDMMLGLVERVCGQAIALDVAGAFVYEASRGPGDEQAHIPFGPTGNHDPRVAQVIRAMEQSIDAPVSTAALAVRIGLSVRGLEQLFAREIGQTPGAYFLTLRLNAARRLVLDTRASITDVASRTGFSSVTSFSRAFRRAYGKAPSVYRSQLRQN